MWGTSNDLTGLDDSNFFIQFSVLCLLLVVLIGASTVYDLQKSFPNKSKLLTSFSLLRNFQTLTSQERDAGDIRSAHSIRFIHAVLLVLSHKAGAFSFNPCTNRTRTVQLLDGPWSGIIRAGSLYTDLFLMLSGMLTAYSLFGKLKRRGEIKVLKEYASRYLRIMPSLAFLIVFCTFILPLLGDGPQWSLVVDHNASLCKQHWWRNLLFIHNWFGFANMCLTHTHHIGVDTELFLLAPLMVLIMWKWPKQGVGAIIVLAIMSTCARYYVTYNNELSYCANFGARWIISVKNETPATTFISLADLRNFTNSPTNCTPCHRIGSLSTLSGFASATSCVWLRSLS